MQSAFSGDHHFCLISSFTNALEYTDYSIYFQQSLQHFDREFHHTREMLEFIRR